MRSPFLKKCHKVRLLLAALCGLALTSHLDAVTTLSNLKRLETDLKSQLAQPTKKAKSVLKRYNALRNAELQAKSPAEAKQMEAVMNRLTAEFKQAKKRPQHTAKNQYEEAMLVTLGGMHPVRRSLSSIDIVSGPSTPKAAAAKPKPPTKPKKMKPPISPKPSPQQIAAHQLKTSHQSVVNAMKTHHAHTEVAAAKAKLARIKTEIAHEEMLDSLSEHSSTSPTHTAPTTPEPVAPEPGTPPPAPLMPPAPAPVPTTPQRPQFDPSSASAFQAQKSKLKKPKTTTPPPATGNFLNMIESSPQFQAIAAASGHKNDDDQEEDDSDWDDSEDED